MSTALASVHAGGCVEEVMAIVTYPCPTQISHEHVALLYCIAITSYWKPHTVRSFLAQHQSDDRYTKYTEHFIHCL